MHLKDVDTYALRTAEGPAKMGTFRALGHGTVNFPEVKAALEKVGYAGAFNYESEGTPAEKAKNHKELFSDYNAKTL